MDDPHNPNNPHNPNGPPSDHYPVRETGENSTRHIDTPPPAPGSLPGDYNTPAGYNYNPQAESSGYTPPGGYNYPPQAGPAPAPYTPPPANPPQYGTWPNPTPPPMNAPQPYGAIQPYNQPAQYGGQPPTQYGVPPQYNPQGYPQPMGYRPAMGYKDPSTAMIIEIVGGIFGFMGLGHIYAGRTTPGILMLIGWWAVIAVSVFVFSIIGVFTCGLGFCLLPVVLWGGPILSGLWLRGLMTGQPMAFNR